MENIILIILLGISTSKMEMVNSNGGQTQTLGPSLLNKKEAENTEEYKVNEVKMEENFLYRNGNFSSGTKHHVGPIVKREVLHTGSDLEFGGPLCYGRYVTGNCRYRSHREYCFHYEWTAYAIVQNLGGGVRSVPPGIHVKPGIQERVEVWLKVPCCISYVSILTTDPYNQELVACVVNIRELQGIYPAEIAGMVIGVLVFLSIFIMSTVLMMKKRKQAKEVTQPSNSSKPTRGSRRS